MFRLRHLGKSFTSTAFLCAVAFGGILSGCGDSVTADNTAAPQDGALVPSAPTEVPAAVEAPPAVAAVPQEAPEQQNSAPESEVPTEAMEAAVLEGDFVALNAIEERNAVPATTLQEHWERLTAVMVPKNLIEGMDILAVDTRATGPREYTFSFLFHCTAPLTEDYLLSVTAAVAPENAHFIKNPTKPDGIYTTSKIRFKDNPTSTWKPGEYHVAQMKLESKPVPYNLTVRLQARDEKGELLGNPGNAVELGWQSDQSKMSAFLKLAALEAEYKQSGQTSALAEEVFAERWTEATAILLPRTLAEGLDLLGVDTRVTGEKQTTFSFLLKSTQDIATDYHLSVIARVLPEHKKFIEPAKEDANYFTRPVLLYGNPTSSWKAGEYHVIELVVDGEVIPYNLSVLLQTRDEQKRVSGTPGAVADLGWQSASSPNPEMVTIHDLQHEWRESGKYTDEVAKAFDRRWARLAKDLKPQQFNEDVQILGVETKATGEKEYTFSFLLRAAKDISQEYHLNITAHVDRSHLQHIKPSKEDGTYISRPILLYTDPTSKWKSGEYHVAQLKLETEPIPYRLSASLQSRDSNKRVTGTPGNVVDLGWQADVAE